MKEIAKRDTDIFQSKAKLNFQSFQDLYLPDKDLTLLQMSSSAVLGGHFEKTNFFNASFLSSKFSNVDFIGCNLKSTDICSVWASECHFMASDFSDATITDSTFIHCRFDETVFLSVSLTNCQFLDCTFEQFPISDSTVVLNTFTRCQIKNTGFTESFYYQIFEDCTFKNADISPELFGFNFVIAKESYPAGISRKDLEKTETDFWDSLLFVNAAILRMNMTRGNFDQTMFACAVALEKMIEKDILVKTDEIQFLKKVTTYLSERKLLAPVSTIRIWQVLDYLIHTIDKNTAYDKALPYIREYSNMLYFDYQRFQQELQRRIETLPSDVITEGTVELKTIFAVEPEIEFLNFLKQFSLLCPGCPAPRLIRTEYGSFDTFHEVASVIIPYLQTFFSLMGIVTPFLIYRMQKNDAKTTKNVGNERAREPADEGSVSPDTACSEQVFATSAGKGTDALGGGKASAEQTPSLNMGMSTAQSPILLPNMTIISNGTNFALLNVFEVIAMSDMLKSPTFCGYNAQNIQNVSIFSPYSSGH